VRFQRAELHEETVSGTHMVPSLFIGPRSLLNDCNHSATAIFWRSATLVLMFVSLSWAAACDACHNWLMSTIGS